jgi:hypothetical protein
MYQSYNIKAGVVHELKIKVKLNKVIKWFVLLLWSVRPRTATGMDGTLTLIFRKSETSRDIIKSF